MAEDNSPEGENDGESLNGAELLVESDPPEGETVGESLNGAELLAESDPPEGETVGESPDGEDNGKQMKTPQLLVDSQLIKIGDLTAQIGNYIEYLINSKYEIELCTDILIGIQELNEVMPRWDASTVFEKEEESVFVITINIINLLKDLEGNVPFLDALIKQYLKAINAVIWNLENVLKPNESFAMVSHKYYVIRRNEEDKLRRKPYNILEVENGDIYYENIPHDIAMHEIDEKQYLADSDKLEDHYPYWRYIDLLKSLRNQAQEAQVQTKVR